MFIIRCLSSAYWITDIPPPGSGVLIIYAVTVFDTASTVPTQIENIPRGVVQPSRYCFIITFTKYLERYEQQRENKFRNVAPSPIAFDDYYTSLQSILGHKNYSLFSLSIKFPRFCRVFILKNSFFFFTYLITYLMYTYLMSTILNKKPLSR